MIDSVIVIVFMIGYLAIAMEHKLGVNKTAVAILTAVACWVLVVIRENLTIGSLVSVSASLGEHFQGTSQIVFFIIGAMTIVQTMESHGGFQVVADIIRTRNKRVLLWIVAFITFFLSAVLDNLTTAIVMVTLLHRLLDDREDRLIFSGVIIIAANAGGAWTPIGDVTTTMLWIGERISTARIMSILIVPSLVSLLVPLTIFTFQLKAGEAAIDKKVGPPAEVGMKTVFFLGLGALIFVPVFKSLTGLPPVIGILLGLGVMWLVTDLMHIGQREHLRVPRMLGKIDLASPLFFLGILLAVSALDTAGLLQSLAQWMELHWGNKDIIVTMLGLSSAVIDNVPLTAATMGMYDLVRYPMDHRIWEMLAYAVGTGGSILIIGSAAGVVVMGIEKITFGWYLRRISFPALLGYLAGIGAYVALTGMMT